MSKYRLIPKLIVFTVFMLGLVVPGIVSAQSSQGGLRGTVKDAQGVIPGVTVLLSNDANGIVRETVTNESGEYSFPAVEPATYTVKVSVQGFRSFERQGVRISTQQFVGLDIVLEVGTLSETITVTADAPLIESTNASVGGVIDAQALESIPTAGRSVFLMATLEPTVQASGNAHWNRMQDQVGNSAVSMGGGPVRANNFLVDGFPVTDLQNRASTNPSMEAVQEMKVQVHTYDAEMGRTGGGVMNMSARSGSNDWKGSGYTVYRPTSLSEQLLIPKLQHQKNVPEEWKNGGGGFGGPIVKNKTFFWSAGEKYVNNQPQQNSFLVPTDAERRGDFSGLVRPGTAGIIRDPLTGQPFPGNIIPANRISPVGQKLINYFPKADNQVDTGASNFSMTDLLPNAAYQFTTKADHHFNDAVALSGFVLRQVTHEANSNYNPENKFVGGSYQLDRTINTFVLNNTYILNSSTVLTVRGGYNKFNDNYNLPYEFDAKALWNNAPFTSGFSDTNRFPTLSITGYKGSGFTNRQANGYYQYGTNATLSRLAGSHNMKIGGDYRIIGVDSINYGASTGTFTFSGLYSGNAAADLLLGYPVSGNVPLNVEVDGFVKYSSLYVQDDWRMNDKFTVNYGVRLERETGLIERENQATVGFDYNATSPLNSKVNVIDPVTGLRRDIKGGLLYAGVNGAPEAQGNQPAVKVAPRIGMVYSFSPKTVVRGGWGLYYAPWNYAAAGTNGWGQIGYSATTEVVNPSAAGAVPTTTIDNPFPNGIVQPSGNSLGLLTGAGGEIRFVDQTKGAPRVQQYSVDVQRELPGAMSVSVGYTGLTGSQLGWGGSGNALININQLDPKYQAMGGNFTLDKVANPFFGVPEAGQFAPLPTIERGQLLRPYPQFGNVYMMQSTGAHSQYHAGIIQLRKRATGIWGGNFSYTYSRLTDNQWGESNYYSSSPGVQNSYTVIPGSEYYNPDQEYGRSLLDTPHKIVISPIFQLPLGEGHKYFSSGLMGVLFGGWQLAPVATFQAGFPIGVSQNTPGTPYLMGGSPRPNLVEGQDFLVPGNITDRIKDNVTDNLYLNKAAFTTAPANQFGNAPRTLPGAYSPWRNNVDLSVSKAFHTGRGTTLNARMEVLNIFNIVQWAAPASTAFGNTSFGQITNQANNMRLIQFTARFQF
ncbi:MAG TPA: TonB-dependent receptor [Vicinamibacterales bacterium]|nr:TonB-dependent receptor [Vicinamibacterales bacterium]